MITAAEAMVRCLEEEGVKVVFGYPGAAICPFYDALASTDIKHILVRQEQNGGHAASGYSRISGRPGVCIATSGPGATNLLTAIATAYADSIPIVAITGQVSTDLLGRDVFQEVDITGAAEPFVKHSYLVKDATQIPRIFKEAFHIAATGRPGPVLIDVPVDIQNSKLEFEYPEAVDIRGYKPSVKGHVGQIKKVAEAISHAERPLICAGGGVINAGACKQLASFAECCDIPVITTMMGLGILPTDHPLNFGMLGMHGCRTANEAVLNSDLLLLIGARVSDRAIASPSVLEGRTKIIHIDVDPAEIGKNVEPTQGCVNPKQFLSMLSDKAPSNTTVVADVGQNQIWTANYFKIRDGKFITTGGMGTMGYSVPAAMGAKLADMGHNVIAICGDGSFQMQMMELATLCQFHIPLKIVVMKNNRLGMVRELQTKNWGDRQMAVHLDGSPNFAILASAYGIPAKTITDISQAGEAINEFLQADTSFLLEVIVDENESTL